METRRKFLQATASLGIASIIASRVAPAFAKERTAKSGITMEQAWKVHRKCLIVDAHQDTSVRRFSRKADPKSWLTRDTSYHTDVPRMLEGGQQYTGLFLIEDATATDLWTITEFILEQVASHPEKFVLILSSKDAVRAGKTGKIGILMEIEGPARWLNGNLNILRLLYRLGLRSLHITHGEGGKEPTFLQGARSITGPCTPADRENQRKTFAGLTPFGREVVKTNDELGIITDLSHTNDKAFFDVIEMTARPPIMSHTGVFSLSNTYRCLTDDQIKALAANGGVMGIVVLPGFIDADPKKATVDRIVDHIAYVADLVGIDHVGFGSDYDGFPDPPIIPDVSQLVILTQAMLSRGFTEDEIKKFWGENFVRVFQQTIDTPKA
ncbi:MAG: dipeptidase [Candidatus Latescibacterota bacterium]